MPKTTSKGSIKPRKPRKVTGSGVRGVPRGTAAARGKGGLAGTSGTTSRGKIKRKGVRKG